MAVLDGIQLETERTATTVTNPLSFDGAYGVNFGAFLPPGMLTVGTHQLQTTLVVPSEPDIVETISFTVVAC